MARKQTSKRLNRFLDLIGLVDSDRDDAEQEPARTSRVPSARRAGTDDEFDEFDEFEEKTPPRRTIASTNRRASRVNLEEDDEFGESQGWTNASPGYGSRGERRRQMPTAAAPARTGRGAASRVAGYRERDAKEAGRASSYAARRASETSAYRAGEQQPRYRSAARSLYGSAPARQDESAFDMPPQSGAAGYQRHQTVIYTLRSIDECKDVILSLIDKKSVLLNLQALDATQSQRAVDTMSGATYAIGATISRASDRTWLITPSNVEVERSSEEEDGYGGYRGYRERIQ